MLHDPFYDLETMRWSCGRCGVLIATLIDVLGADQPTRRALSHWKQIADNPTWADKDRNEAHENVVRVLCRVRPDYSHPGPIKPYMDPECPASPDPERA